MDGRTLLLGDWSPAVRDPLDLIRASLVAGAVAFALLGEGGAINLAVTGAAAVAVRFVELPRVYDLAFLLAMSICGWGEALRLYDRFTYFDAFVHFIVPLLGAPVVYIVLARLDVLPDPRDETVWHHYVGMFVVTLSLGLAIGAVWEIIEWTSDHTLGTKLSLGDDDTIGDLVADALGALAGAALLIAWARFGWGSVRRIPGDNRREATEATPAG